MQHKYGEWTNDQISSTVKDIRTQIFFLLLCVDPETKHKYAHVNVDLAFTGLLHKLGGLNSCLFEHPSLVTTISLLEKARLMVTEPNFKFGTYRKLVLDAGSEIEKIKEG